MNDLGIKIKIKVEEFKVYKTNMSIIDFELMAKKNISDLNDSFTDNMMLFFCMVKNANRQTFKYTFEEFMDLIDENDDNIKIFNNYTNSLVKEVLTKSPGAVSKKKK